MTDNEIIKALECCTNARKGCKQCPLYCMSSARCITVTMTSALDLINRLQEMNNALIAGQETLQNNEIDWESKYYEIAKILNIEFPKIMEEIKRIERR